MLKRREHLFLNHFLIVRMNGFYPVVELTAEGTRQTAVNFFQFRGPGDTIRRDIPLPGADAGGLLGQLNTFVGGRQLTLGDLQFPLHQDLGGHVVS